MGAYGSGVDVRLGGLGLVGGAVVVGGVLGAEFVGAGPPLRGRPPAWRAPRSSRAMFAFARSTDACAEEPEGALGPAARFAGAGAPA